MERFRSEAEACDLPPDFIIIIIIGRLNRQSRRRSERASVRKVRERKVSPQDGERLGLLRAKTPPPPEDELNSSSLLNFKLERAQLSARLKASEYGRRYGIHLCIFMTYQTSGRVSALRRPNEAGPNCRRATCQSGGGQLVNQRRRRRRNILEERIIDRRREGPRRHTFHKAP